MTVFIKCTTMADENESAESVENKWMVRPCHLYEEEYSECTSIRARFNQYFIHGELIDCTQWKRDQDNCLRWEKSQNMKALKELVESEGERRRQRLEAHYKNNVWKKREAPPDDWNKPLPEKFQKQYENSYLELRARELAGEKEPEFKRTLCVLS